MEPKELFKKSYNSFTKEYRILATEKSNGINKTLFFDRIGALTIARQNKLNAPLHTFELYPYKPYWVYNIYWFFLKSIKKQPIPQTSQPKEKHNKPNVIISFISKFWWQILIPLLFVILSALFNSERIMNFINKHINELKF